MSFTNILGILGRIILLIGSPTIKPCLRKYLNHPLTLETLRCTLLEVKPAPNNIAIKPRM